MRSGGSGASWLAASGNTLWVSNTFSGSVTKIDARRRKRVKTVKVGDSPVNLDVVGGSVWVPCDRDDTLWRINRATGKVVERLATARNPAVVAGAEGDVSASMHEAGAVWRIHAS